jgi:hypothetical protein
MLCAKFGWNWYSSSSEDETQFDQKSSLGSLAPVNLNWQKEADIKGSTWIIILNCLSELENVNFMKGQ